MRDIIIPDVGDQIGKKIKDPQLKAVAFPVNEPGKNTVWSDAWSGEEV